MPIACKATPPSTTAAPAAASMPAPKMLTATAIATAASATAICGTIENAIISQRLMNFSRFFVRVKK